jgi:hypothetical protein
MSEGDARARTGQSDAIQEGFLAGKRNITACRDKKCALHGKEMRAGFPEKRNRMATPLPSLTSVAEWGKRPLCNLIAPMTET